MLSEEKKLLKIFKAQVEKEETEYFSVNAYTQLLYDSHKTVLNLITKLQKENEEQKATINKQSLDISNNLLELQQKDKKIDLMAEYWNTGLAMCNNCDKIVEKYEENTCKECIKQYFETKAKGE